MALALFACKGDPPPNAWACSKAKYLAGAGLCAPTTKPPDDDYFNVKRAHCLVSKEPGNPICTPTVGECQRVAINKGRPTSDCVEMAPADIKWSAL